ncbi:MAG: hypothetical protein ACXWZ2_16360, partial [Mycobacterium sp.]
SSLSGAGTTDGTPMLLSRPGLVDPAVPDYSGLVIDKRAVVSAVGPIKVATSEHELFSADSVLLRATWRFGHVVVRPEPDRQVRPHSRDRKRIVGYISLLGVGDYPARRARAPAAIGPAGRSIAAGAYREVLD